MKPLRQVINELKEANRETKMFLAERRFDRFLERIATKENPLQIEFKDQLDLFCDT